MAHEFESGMFVRTAAWHGLGVVLPEAPTTAEAIVASGLDWTVQKQPMFVEGPEGPVAVPEWQAVVRSSDHRTLGIVGPYYTPIQNETAFEWFDPFLESGLATIETAGSLRNGECIWILAKLCGMVADVGPGDPVVNYLLLNNWHTGKRKLSALHTKTRVVCMNTLDAAMSMANAALWVRHDQKAVETLMEMRKVVDTARQTFELTMEEYRAMRRKGIDALGLRQYVKAVFSPPQDRKTLAAEKPEDFQVAVPTADDADDDRMPRAWEAIENVFETGPGADIAGKTVWGAFNAVTHWVDHVRGNDDEARLYGTWFGDGAKLRTRARADAMALIK